MQTSAQSGQPATAPVAFLIFNRPDCTRRTFAAIREARPPRLLVVADGPRENRPGEAERCAQTRAVVTEGVDWPCEVETNFSPVNLGCRRRVSSGLDWVFSRAEEAIILEDDCLPDPSFFPFCEALLDTYRHDRRVMMIAGARLETLPGGAAYSYRFSKISHVWGWASWRRAWQLYDVDMAAWPEFRDRGKMANVFADPDMAEHWRASLENVHQGLVDTWDYQLSFAAFAQNCVSIVPGTNLVTNIGFSAEATHTSDPTHPLARLTAGAMAFPLLHPPFMLADDAADKDAVRPARRHGGWKPALKRLLSGWKKPSP